MKGSNKMARTIIFDFTALSSKKEIHYTTDVDKSTVEEDFGPTIADKYAAVVGSNPSGDRIIRVITTIEEEI